MSEEIKNEKLKETQITEEDLDKVSGGAGIGGGVGMGPVLGDADMDIKESNARKNH